MNRKLKGLGIALVSALAMNASAAVGASASGEQFHSPVPHTFLSLAGGTQTFNTTVDSFTCESITGSGTINAATVSEITITNFTHNGCEGKNLALKTHVQMRSCDYLLTAEATPHGRVHISCTVFGDEIRINATFLGAELACVRVPAQTPTGGGVSYANGGAAVVVTATVTGIEYTEIGICDSNGEPPNVANNGTYTATVLITGKDTNGNAVTFSQS